jgi:hypothetical protein
VEIKGQEVEIKGQEVEMKRARGRNALRPYGMVELSEKYCKVNAFSAIINY